MILKIIRKVLGFVVLTADRLTRPQPLKRSPQEQTKVNSQTSGMSLYQFHTCPFCIKVQRAIHRLGLEIEVKDAKNDAQSRQELEKMGGKIQVPCLRLKEEGKDDVWMYESNDIISHLEKKFG